MRSLCRTSDAFYIRAYVRDPEARFFDLSTDRAGLGVSVAHCVRWDHMCVLMAGTGAQIAVRQTAAIRLFLGERAPFAERRIRNVSDAAGGYYPAQTQVFLFLCYGSAERARYGRLMW